MVLTLGLLPTKLNDDVYFIHPHPNFWTPISHLTCNKGSFNTKQDATLTVQLLSVL